MADLLLKKIKLRINDVLNSFKECGKDHEHEKQNPNRLRTKFDIEIGKCVDQINQEIEIVMEEYQHSKTLDNSIDVKKIIASEYLKRMGILALERTRFLSIRFKEFLEMVINNV